MTTEFVKDAVKEKRKTVAHAYSCLLEDRDEVLTIVYWKDGEITSFIEPVGDDD